MLTLSELSERNLTLRSARFAASARLWRILMDYRVRIYATKTLVREKSFPGFVEAIDYFQSKCHEFMADERIRVYLDEKKGSEWITRAHSVAKKSFPDSGNPTKRELTK